MEKGLIKKTGKDLNHWKKVVQQSGIEKHSEIIAYLKKNHEFTHGFANFVALKFRAADAASQSDSDLLANQYRGKEDLKPIYEAILEKVSAFGSDITITPKKDSVSLIRGKQFALVKPATKNRIDLGLKLKDFPTTERLGSSGPFGSMCTHRVQIVGIDGVDSELVEWLHEAYNRAL